jgi:hypothetical protein
LLEAMIKNFDDGRSKSFYCIAATLLPITDLEISYGETEQRVEVSKSESDDIKTKSKIFKELLNNFAIKEGIKMELRKKAKQDS